MVGSDFLKALQGREEITISVTGRQSGRVITLPVWFVLDGKTLWLLPVRGSRSQWFRNVRAHPTITIRARRARRTFEARPTTSGRVVKAVVQKFRSKYTPAEIARYYAAFDAAVQVTVRQ